MAVIDESYAWHLIQDARCRGLLAPAILDGRSADAPSIHVDAQFGWTSTAKVTPEAGDLLNALLPVALGGASFVVAQLGQSLDGRIATESGHSHYVTGEASRVHLHRLRALVDAVIVGAGTVAADDPQLTVRHVPGANPVRVVLDPRGRVSGEQKVFSDGAAPTLHIASGVRAPAPSNVERVQLENGAGGVAPQAILDCLAARGLRRVLVEGGGETISRFLQAGLLDRLHVVVAPMLIGSGRPAVRLAPIERLDTALRPPCRSQSMGADMFFDLDLSEGR
ncbi:bifunctional deaminase-reductase-like protein [Salinisphaera dokdonensis CL-ES53]|uniref:Bifunctional deaminase-reductase-like protein n=1 Tax=Salinisphaera dokdonensis CL-ES53 TaxID=1304272 RepID=A0ABV2B3Q5_9GAMM